MRADPEEAGVERGARRPWRPFANFRLVSPPGQVREEMRRYWRRDVPLQMLLWFPLGFAFDQGLRGALIAGWVPVNVWTLLVVRPMFDYLAMRSLAKWLRIDCRGLWPVLGPWVAIDAARSFGASHLHFMIAVFAWSSILLILEVLFESVWDKPKPAVSPRS